MKYLKLILALCLAYAPANASVLTTQVAPFTVDQGLDYVEDFLGGESAFVVTNSTGATTTFTGTVNGASNMGFMELSTGTLSTAPATVAANNVAGIRLGGGLVLYEAAVRVEDLSSGTEEYIFDIGFCDSAVAVDCVDGVFFRYDAATSANWLKCSSSNSTQACSSTGIAVAADTWYKLKFIVSATGLRADFYVNGTSGGNLTANIPIGASRETGMEVRLFSTEHNGVTAARKAYVDYIRTRYQFTTAR